MIDYDKLKKAHELAKSTTDHWFRMEFGLTFGEIELIQATKFIRSFANLDDLINELQLIVRLQGSVSPEPRFEVGDEVWTYSSGKINQWRIEMIRWEQDSNDYRVDLYKSVAKGSFLEKDLYPSKRLLAVDQVKYWIALECELNRQEGKEEHCSVSGAKLNKACQHEPDGIEHVMGDEGGSFSMNRCRNCFEFFSRDSKPEKSVAADDYMGMER